MFFKILTSILAILVVVNIYSSIVHKKPPKTTPKVAEVIHNVISITPVPSITPAPTQVPTQVPEILEREPVKLSSRGDLEREDENKNLESSPNNNQNINSNDDVEKIIPEKPIKILNMVATAYDLSIESCGKSKDHPAYGITASGTKATKGRTIAVDKRVIPLGTKVYVTFPDKYKHLNGDYIAEDTGRLIKGNRIDVFLGENVRDECMEFGKQKVQVGYYIK